MFIDISASWPKINLGTCPRRPNASSSENRLPVASCGKNSLSLLLKRFPGQGNTFLQPNYRSEARHKIYPGIFCWISSSLISCQQFPYSVHHPGQGGRVTMIYL